MELQNGRPADAAGRMDKEIRTYDFLDSLGVDYQRMDHEAAFTMEACKEVDEALGVEMCKNLFLCNRQKTDFYLLLIPGTRCSRRKNSQNRSAVRGFLLRVQNIWKNIWILRQDRSALWD